ncbi:inducible alternative oxidase 2 [Cystobasidiomycetes sp. EMM_F5]
MAIRPTFEIRHSALVGLRAASSSHFQCLHACRGYASSSSPVQRSAVAVANPPTAAEVADSSIKTEIPTISQKQPISNLDQSQDWVLYHPVYTEEQVVHHEAKNVSDRFARSLVKMARYGFDLVTGYKHASPDAALKTAAARGQTNLSLEEMRKMGLVMDPKQWLSHLLTFMKIAQPTWLMRAFIFAAQGVFYNAFFLGYLISPKTAHRFVGSLEEEAVYTYTVAIQELEAGRLPEWENLAAPRIALDYWRMKEDAKMLDLLYAVRADEAGHRFTNHTFANVKDQDFNPFGIKEPDTKIQSASAGFTREEAMKWYGETSEELRRAQRARTEASTKDAKQSEAISTP